MADAFDRLRRIANLLASNPDGFAVQEIADHLEVPYKLVCADLELLSLEGRYAETDEIDEPYAPDTVWYWLRNRYVPPLSFTVREATGLLLSFQERSDERFSDLVLQLKNLFHLDKAELAVRKERIVYKGYRALYPSPSLEKTVLELRKAAEKSLVLSLRYYSRSEQVEVNVSIDPYGVVFESSRGLWYLVARERSTGEIRLFNTLRIKRVSSLGTHFEYPKNFEVREYFRLAWGVEIGKEPVKVRVKFHPHFDVHAKVSKAVVSGRPDAKLTREPDGALILEDVISGTEEFRRWIRGFGRSAEVLEPAELRSNMLAGAKRMLARYSGEEVEYDEP